MSHDQLGAEDDVVERGECLHGQIGAEDDVVESEVSGSTIRQVLRMMLWSEVSGSTIR